MSELDKLEEYLKNKGIPHKRINTVDRAWHRNQIIVYDKHGNQEWDAICHQGSYGYEQGLLEIYGNIVDYEKDGDSVAGWLTAEDVIKRIEHR